MSAAEVRVLGPVEVVGDHGPVAMPAKHRRLLAALVVARGRPSGVDELVDALWGETPPASARKLLQIYVSALRKALPEPLAIETHRGSYALAVGADDLDASRFERLVTESAAAQRDNPALAASLAEQALGLWHGRAYGVLAYDDLWRVEAERLEELRLVALEERIAARIALGTHAEVLGEALVLAAEEPLRERAHELAMLALYRSGRQSEALEHYATARVHLRDELGLEPGSALRGLQARILHQDPELELAGGDAAAAKTLPVPPNSLVGRDAELRQLRRLLERREARLLVLTGAGGSGKTRLALAVARETAGQFANGALLVELAPLGDPGLVLSAIAQALDLEGVDSASLESVAKALEDRELLIVLDNAEHLRDAAPTYSALLARAPRVTLLVTSRAVLHVTGEHVFPVLPLGEEEAVELFVQRARDLQPSFERTPENETELREICSRLDGLPLAIELAAARVRTVRLETVLERLTGRLQFLTRGPRDMPARQQTLRATLDWSYDLLSEDERRLLARISVFPVGATLDGAAAVCLGGDEGTALDLLEGLADASLIAPREQDGVMRYRMLETVRQYAAERLEALDGCDTRRRHAEWCLELVERAEPELSGERQVEWLEILEAEHDNARVALDHLTAEGEQALALRLAVALSRFWYVRGHLTEARRRLEEVLATAMEDDPLLLRRARTAAAAIALLQGDYPAATAFSEGALESARAAGEPRFVANALSNLGAIVLAAGNHDRATIALEEAVSLAREVGDERIAALAINNLGDLALTVGDFERAEPLFEESQALLRARGDTANIARSLFNLGAVKLMLGDRGAADALFREGLRLAAETGDMEDVAWCLEGLASLAADAAEGERAATLLGAAQALVAQMGAHFKPFERQLHEATQEQAQRLCGKEAYVATLEAGASLQLAATLEVALGSP